MSINSSPSSKTTTESVGQRTVDFFIKSEQLLCWQKVKYWQKVPSNFHFYLFFDMILKVSVNMKMSILKRKKNSHFKQYARLRIWNRVGLQINNKHKPTNAGSISLERQTWGNLFPRYSLEIFYGRKISGLKRLRPLKPQNSSATT